MDRSIISFFGVVAYAASWQFVVPFVAFLFVWFVERGALFEAKTLLGALVASEAVVFLVKIFVNSPRRTDALVPPEDPWSFPSAHTNVAVVLYGLLALFVWLNPTMSLAVKIFVAIVAVLLAVLVGMSRVVLRVHRTKDVIAGAIIGLAFLTVSMWYVLKYTL